MFLNVYGESSHCRGLKYMEKQTKLPLKTNVFKCVNCSVCAHYLGLKFEENETELALKTICHLMLNSFLARINCIHVILFSPSMANNHVSLWQLGIPPPKHTILTSHYNIFSTHCFVSYFDIHQV